MQYRDDKDAYAAMKNRLLLSAFLLTASFVVSARYRMRAVTVEQAELPLLALSLAVVLFQAVAEGRL